MKQKNICQLCLDERKKEKVTMYVGGYIGFAHPSCLEIAEMGISLYERYVLYHYKILPEIQKKRSHKIGEKIKMENNEDIIKELKKKLNQLQMSEKGDFESGYNNGYSVCIEDIERLSSLTGKLEEKKHGR